MKQAIVIIGMSAGGDFRRLDGVENDVTAVHGFFTYRARYDIVEIVRDRPEAVVLQVIERVLDQLEPGDRLVIYFAGHGHEVDSRHVWLCTGARRSMLKFLKEVIQVDHIRAMTEGRGLYRSVVSDCCFDDPYTDSSMRGGPATLSDAAASNLRNIGTEPITTRAAGVAGSFALINACDKGQTAVELGRMRRGLFTTSWLDVMSTAVDGGLRVETDLALSNQIATRMRAIGTDNGLEDVPQPLYIGSGEPPVLLEGERRGSKDGRSQNTVTNGAVISIAPANDNPYDPTAARRRYEETRRKKEREAAAAAEQARLAVARVAAEELKRKDAEFDILKMRLANELEGPDLTIAEKTVEEMLSLRPDDAETLDFRRFIGDELESLQLAAQQETHEREFNLLRLRLNHVIEARDFETADQTIDEMLTLMPDDAEALSFRRMVRAELESIRVSVAEAARKAAEAISAVAARKTIERAVEAKSYWVAANEICTLTGHHTFLNCVTFSPDGRILASSATDGIKLWDVATGKEIRVLGWNSSAEFVAFSPDGAILASGDSGDVILWEVATGKCLRTLKANHLSISYVTFSTDGETLASADEFNGTVKLWDPRTGELRRTLGELKTRILFSNAVRRTLTRLKMSPINMAASVTSVRFCPDGRAFASAYEDGTVKILDAETGKVLRTLTGHSSMVSTIAFTPDGRILASGGSGGTIELCEIATGKVVRTLLDRAAWFKSMAFSPDGKTLVSGDRQNGVKLWDTATGNHVGNLLGHTKTISSVAFSPDGRTLASGSWDNTVKLWDVSKITQRP